MKTADVVMMRSPEAWSRWPVLPLVRGLVCGLLVDSNPGLLQPTVYIANLWDLRTGPLGPQLAGKPVIEYASFEALVADGWRVD